VHLVGFYDKNMTFLFSSLSHTSEF